MVATISGSVLFNSTNTLPATGAGINNVPVVLRSTTTGKGIVVLTNASGNFSFSNVLADTYTIVEAWGTSGGVATPANFTNAVTMSAPTPADPPVANVPSPPTTTNAIQSLSPNTVNLTIADNTSTTQNFVDGPIANIPINKPGVTIVGSNLITAAGNGIWGTLAAGSAANISPSSAPYPTAVPGFTYVQASATNPTDGSYSVTNINTRNIYNAWFNMADHTSRDETGNFQLVNGSNPGALIFTQSVTVIPNKTYLLSLWISNILPTVTPGALPQVGVLLKDSGNATIFNQVLSNIAATTIPTWNETATLLNVGNNSSVTLQIYSNGPAAGGNDYAIDDIVIQEATVTNYMSVTKSVSPQFADVGDVLNYTVVLNNTSSAVTAYNMVFSDTIPTGTTFNTGSVRINGTTVPSFNPTPPGFTITSPLSLSPNAFLTINFAVTVNTIPSINPVVNSALNIASFLPIAGGSTVTQSVLSNSVNTTINHAEISSVKSGSPNHVTFGDTLTYTITLNNFGNTLANNIILKDTIPTGTSFVSNSVTLNGVTIPGASPSPPTGVTVGTISSNSISTLTFNVLVTTLAAVTPITNSAGITYNYTSNPTIPTIESGSTNTAIISNTFNYASITSAKSANSPYADTLSTVTYFIALRNTGNTIANSIRFIDTIPSGMTFVANSLKQDATTVVGSPAPPGITLPNSIASGGTSTISFRVTVSSTIPSPNPVQNVSSTAYLYTADPSTSRTVSNTSNSNNYNIQINNANLGSISKSVNLAFAKCGDTLTYTITIPNNGNVAATNVVYKDTLPNGVSLVTNSVKVNGVTIPGASPVPPTGVTVGTISAGSSATVVFDVTVTC